MTESESVALPFGDSAISILFVLFVQHVIQYIPRLIKIQVLFLFFSYFYNNSFPFIKQQCTFYKNMILFIGASQHLCWYVYSRQLRAPKISVFVCCTNTLITNIFSFSLQLQDKIWYNYFLIVQLCSLTPAFVKDFLLYTQI